MNNSFARGAASMWAGALLILSMTACRGEASSESSASKREPITLPPQPRIPLGTYVTTQHNDVQRTGANLLETDLTPAAVAARGLTKKIAVKVDKSIVAQALYEGGASRTVYASTVGNTVYAIAADTGAVVWSTSLRDGDDDAACAVKFGANYWPAGPTAATATPLPPDTAAPSLRCRPRGIQSTPVLDVGARTLYVVYGTMNTQRSQAPLAWAPPTCLPQTTTIYCQNAPNVGWQENKPSANQIAPACTKLPLADGCASLNATYAQNWQVAINWINGASLFGVTAAPFNAAWWLAAIDVTTGAVLKRTAITGSVGSVLFAPGAHMNRPGLLLKNDHIYVGFGSASEYVLPFHGWIFRYDVGTFAQSASYVTTPHVRTLSEGGGVWQAGGGLAADDSNNVYFASGNGATGSGGNWSNALFKLDANLVPAGTPFVAACPPEYPLCDVNDYRQNTLNWKDLDLGAGGTMIIGEGAHPTLVGGGKTGVFYLMNATAWQPTQALRGFQNQWYPYLGAPSHLPSAGPVTFPGNPPFNEYPNGGLAPHLHGTPVYWHAPDGSGRVYAWSEKDVLKAFRYDLSTALLQPTPVAQGLEIAHQSIMPGGMLSLSANGSSPDTGIVWATLPYACSTGICGMLLAYNAETLLQVFSTNLVNAAGNAVSGPKWASPTIADGMVILGTSGGAPELQIFTLGN